MVRAMRRRPLVQATRRSWPSHCGGLAGLGTIDHVASVVFRRPRGLPNHERCLMSMRAIAAGFAALLALATSPSLRAQSPISTPWYATAILGASGQSGQTIRFENGPTSLSASTSYNPDILAGAAIGRSFTDGWRAELEFVYQKSQLDRASFGPGGPEGKGDYASTSVALNGLKEFNLFGNPSVRTYLGLGVAWLTEVDIDFEGGPVGRSYSGDGVGVQFLFGARYDLTPRWFVDAGTRYLYASNLKLDGESGAVGQIKADYRPWALTFAVGYRF